MVMFKLILGAHFAFLSHVINNLSERQLIEQPVKVKPVEEEALVGYKGRSRKWVLRTGRLKVNNNEVSFFKGWFVIPRLTLEGVLEGWSPPGQNQHSVPPLTLVTKERNKSLSIGTNIVPFGSGVAITLAITMLFNWLMGRRKRHDDAPHSHLVAPMLRTWPQTTLRPMTPEVLRAILDNRRATVVNVETLLRALYLDAYLQQLENQKFAALLSFTNENVLELEIPQHVWANIIDAAEYLDQLSTQLLKFE